MGVAQGTVIWIRLLLLLMLAMITFPGIVHGLLTEGLYVTNKTDILFIFNPESSSENVISVYKQMGRIVGLAYDKCNDHLFWSNLDVVNRGIYRGSLNAEGKIDNVTKIVETDVIEVNSLSFDWVSRHLYWTDSRKKTIEVSDSDGSNRRILTMTGQGSPRGIYADPIHGYLFWTDQGHKHIARSQLDGSDRKIIVTDKVNLPNQITVYNNKLYWVDSNDKTFESSDLDGRQRMTTSVKLANGQHIFGLAIHDNRAYVSNWVNGQLIAIDTDGNNVAKGTQNLGKEEIFSAIYVKASYQPKRVDPCERKDCAALCLPVRANDTRCSCPSYGGKVLNDADGKTCINPKNYVLMVAMADSGYVGFFDPSSSGVTRDFYVVGSSLRPVAVAYDPIAKNVFWSDVRERTVHLANINGTNHRILLRGKHGVGLVEGMVVDVDRRQLYYTNIGSIYIDTIPYSWHRVETISLQDLTDVKVKTIVTTADKPRGLALDSQNGHLYYTDWGNRASIVRVNLDGSNPTLIRTGLDNPNGIAVLNNKIYFVDSHFKTRQSTDELHPPTRKNGSLYSTNLDGSDFRDVLAHASVELRTPFGLTATPSGFYVGDWETEALILLNMDGTLSDTIVQGTSGLMSLSYSPFTANPVSGSSSCTSRNCGDICLSKTVTEKSCTCNSYGGKSLDNNGASCSVPSKFLIVADMNSIKLASLDGKDSNQYIAVQGNPYFSNFVGLAYDGATRTVYYSDASRKTINTLDLSNMTTKELYRINQVIDGMVYHDGYLYWTDYTNGRICRLSLRRPSGQNLQHETLVFNRKNPRGIRIHNNAIYWTEWGGTPKISKMQLNTRKVEQIYGSLELRWPNGISIDGNQLYVADGSTRKIFRCELNRNDGCRAIDGTEEVMKHAYDLWATDGGVFYYSDWKTGAVNAFDINKPGKTWTVVEGLMRPTQFHIAPLSSRPTCPAGTCSGGSCVPLWVKHGCECQNKKPTYDLKNCSDVSTTNCAHSSNSYVPGASFSPTPCLNCRCLGTFSWANDPVYNTSVCEPITCPKLNCDPADVQRSPTECCPKCAACRIKITNCPEEPVQLTLPYNQGFVVYDFLPTVKDCLGLAREVSTERTPEGAIYKRGETDVTVTAMAKRINGNGDDRAECKIKVIVRDNTPPSIKCPDDVNAYLTGDETSVQVKWSPPEVSDNDAIEGQPGATRLWGSSFGEGSHTVQYTVRDKSRQESYCSFQVTITKLKTPPQGICKIPQVDNAQLQCTFGLVLQCRIDNCNSQYKLVQGYDLICTNGQWNVPINDELLHGTCIKETRASVRGTVEITVPANEACPGGEIDPNYTRDFLQNAIRKDYMVRSTAMLESIVTVKGCRTSWENLVIDVDVVGRSGDTQNLTIDVDQALSDIKKALEGEFLRVPLKGQSGLRTAYNLTIKTSNATIGCLPGEISKGSGTCEVCGVGTYHETRNDSCVQCLPDSYNDATGQTGCKSCPGGAKSGTGSYIIDQCIDVFNSFWLIVVLAICFGIFVVILFVGVIVCAKRRYASNRLVQASKEPKLTVNKVFDPNLDYDCTYDKIADPVDETPTGNLNDYERLETPGGAADARYDVIGTNPRCSETPEEAGSNGADEDGKSTPPYLQPVYA